MGIIRIRPAQREGARTLTVISGVSGSGKTYTALLMAYGMANGNASKVGLLDTENRRGSLYADILPGNAPFLIGDLVAPFSPDRYIEAILEFQKAGVEVLVIDSGTHEWEGQGGCDDIANAGNPKMPRWNQAKREHKRFMNTLLQCDMHVICCIRAREKSRPGKDENGKTIFISEGLQPIQEKNFMFEATASLMMHDGGTRYELLKMPAALLPAFPGTGYLGVKTGRFIRSWVDGAQQLDPQVEKFRNRLLSVTEKGEEYVKAAWLKVPRPIQEALTAAFYDEIIASAREYDRQRTQFDASDEISSINQQLGGDVKSPTLSFNPLQHSDPS